MRALIALIVVTLALLGAVVHPLSLLLDVLPFDSSGLQSFLTETKFLVADVLGWAVVALLAVMLALVVRGRLIPHRSNGARRPTSSLPSTRMAVGIIAYNEAEAIGDLVRDF